MLLYIRSELLISLVSFAASVIFDHMEKVVISMVRFDILFFRMLILVSGCFYLFGVDSFFSLAFSMLWYFKLIVGGKY